MFNKGVVPTGDMYYWDDVRFGTNTAVSDIDNADLSIYASNGSLVIENAASFVNGTITVFDLTGKQITSSKLSSNYSPININKSGIYIVRVSDANHQNSVTKKLLF